MTLSLEQEGRRASRAIRLWFWLRVMDVTSRLDWHWAFCEAASRSMDVAHEGVHLEDIASRGDGEAPF